MRALHRRLRAHGAVSRTSCCAGCATRRSTRCGERCASSGSATRSQRDHRCRQLPGNRFVQARDHELDGPQPGDPANGSRRWRSTTRSRAAIHVKISGCPNGCSQHHIANIGFYGASIKVGEHTIPAYVAHIGGTYEGGEVRYGHRLRARLPAKRVPEAVERWVRFYESERTRRGVQRVRRRVGTDGVRGSTSRTSRCRSSSRRRASNLFIDWSRERAVRGRAPRGRMRASNRTWPA